MLLNLSNLHMKQQTVCFHITKIIDKKVYSMQYKNMKYLIESEDSRLTIETVLVSRAQLS